MSRPSRHPTTGIFWFRKRVPDALRSVVGKLEEKRSLRTRDPREAKIAHARFAAEVEERWKHLTSGVQSLSQRQAEAVAGEIYRSMLIEYGDDPDKSPGHISALIFDRAMLKPGSATIVIAGADVEASKALLHKLKTSRNNRRIDAWLGERGWLLTPESRALVGIAVDRAILQAREQLYRMSSGDYRPDPDSNRFPKLEKPTARATTKTSTEDTSVMAVFDLYAKESKLKPATIKRWRPIIAQVQAEVPDLRDLTRDWVIGWKDALVARALNPKSIREVYIASLRAVCEWAVENNKISENPAARVKIKVPSKSKTRLKGYTDDEAERILTAALKPVSARVNLRRRAAHRWVPYLCAYTGARVGEIAQLRKSDIQKVDGIWLLWITPEAGTTKDNNARFVAVHPEIMRQGFLDFVSKSKSGPLFYNPASARDGSPANPQFAKVGQRIAKWVREEVGITDTAIRPSHAWRHRFATVSRKVGMDSGGRNYMQGHVPATEGEDYGDWTPEALFLEISKLPVIKTSSL